MNNKFPKNLSQECLQKGFTLLELMVTISISVMMTILVLTANARSTSQLLLANMATSIALSMREAQSSSLSVRETYPGSGNYPGYGVYFTADSNTYVTFTDNNNDNFYGSINPGSGEIDPVTDTANCGMPGSECVQIHTINRGMYVRFLGFGFPKLAIVFHRPNPDPNMSDNTSYYLNMIPFGRVTLASPQGLTRTITMDRTGQIYTKL